VTEVIKIERKVLEKNDAIAAVNRARFAEHGLTVLNIVSSPGAGKTTLLERTLERLNGRLRVGVIEGDVQTDLDARRVARYGVPVVQIVTNGGCHLEANLVQHALDRLDLDGLDLLIIENVGNLVCPANYDLGEAMKVVVLSTTEGDDKPLKYPAMFRNASVLVINKTDLLPHVAADLKAIKRNAAQINPDLLVFETSCTTGAGLADWCRWLESRTARVPCASASA
jgi:hydrogenase nickel incorporation protein HypB